MTIFSELNAWRNKEILNKYSTLLLKEK